MRARLRNRKDSLTSSDPLESRCDGRGDVGDDAPPRKGSKAPDDGKLQESILCADKSCAKKAKPTQSSAPETSPMDVDQSVALHSNQLVRPHCGDGEAAAGLGAQRLTCRMESLVIENFKSYRGRHEIGPLKRFTGVIGPNGAGKSNLMDAISFVLGVPARHMRSAVLSDLVYRASSTADEQGRAAAAEEASVSLRLRLGPPSDEVLVMRRKISRKGGSSVLYINERVVSQEEYVRRLTELNILVKARNFLVFQGDVVEVAQKGLTELGRLFEQVSTSDLLKEECEALENEVKQITNDLRYQNLQRARIEAQKRDLERQVDEVREYEELQEKVKALKVEHYVYKLYINEAWAARTRGDLEDLEKRLGELEASQSAALRSMREGDAKVVRLRSEIKQDESRILESTRGLNSLKTDLARVMESVSFCKKKRAELEQRKKEIHLKQCRQEEFRREREDALSVIDERLKILEASADEAGGAAVKLTKKQHAEYERIKRSTAALTASLKSSVLSLESQERSLVSKIATATSEMEDIKTHEAELLNTIEGATIYIKRNEEETANLVKSLREKEAGLEGDEQELRTLADSEKALLSEQSKLEETLSRCQAGRKDIGRIKRQQEVVRDLQKVFSTNVIYGTVAELCQPTNRKYDVAVSAALGKYHDVVVVDSFDTAKKAVDYLKQHRSGVLEFAPLDTLMSLPPDPRLQQLGEFCRPLLGCVDYAPQFERVYQMALQDSVVVNNLREAEHLAFVEGPSKGLRIKVITLDGEKVLKNGNITVDTSLGHASRFDVREYNRCELGLKALNSKLAELRDSLTPKKEAFLRKSGEVEGMRSLLKSKEARLKLWKSRFTSSQEEINVLRKALTKRGVEIEQAGENLRRCREDLQKLTERILVAEKDAFAALSKEVGVEDLRRHEETIRASALKREEELAALTARKTKLMAELSRVASESDAELSTVTQLVKEMAAAEKKLASDTAELDKVEKHLAAQKAVIENLKLAVEEKQRTEKEAEVEVATQRKGFKTLEGKSDRLKAEAAQLQATAEELLREVIEILRSVILNDVELPLLRGSMAAYRRLIGLSGNHSQGQPGDMCDDEEEQPEIAYASVLSDEIMETSRSKAEVRALETQYEERIGMLCAEINRKNPNLKALDKHRATSAELKALEVAVDLLRKSKECKEKKFHAVRKERAARFLRCYNHVQKAINSIYHRLTGGDGEDSVGGQAFLELVEGDQSECSYNSGILYNVMPPSKRFSDMKRLSGGEKTMAALSLLFALQSYHPSPFFVLDEIDADLDPVNVFSLADYLRKTDFQVIVISHSDRVFSQTDALMGVYIDSARESSGTLSLDLSAYPLVIPSSVNTKSLACQGGWGGFKRGLQNHGDISGHNRLLGHASKSASEHTASSVGQVEGNSLLSIPQLLVLPAR